MAHPALFLFYYKSSCLSIEGENIMKELRFAILGFGGIAASHKVAYDALAREGYPVRLVAICDKAGVDTKKTVTTNLGTIDCGSFEGIGIYTDLDVMLKECRIDVLDICLPTFLHKEFAIRALNSGLHVLCEKPMALNYADAALMLEQDELIAMVSDSGYNRNLAPGSVLMQQPQAGAEVKAGRKIYLTVNSNSGPTLTIPDIADNCDVYEAEIRLRTIGFKIGPKEYVEGDKDWVLSVKCRGREVRAGDKVPADAPVVLVVGNSLTEDEKWAEESQSDMDAEEVEYEFEPETEW